MTLDEWSKKYGVAAPVFESAILPRAPEHNSRYVVGNFTGDVGWDLYHLTDYVVGTVTGGTIWLSKRPRESREDLERGNA